MRRHLISLLCLTLAGCASAQGGQFFIGDFNSPQIIGGSSGLTWTDLSDEGTPTTVRDTAGHLDAAGSISVVGTTISVDLDSTSNAASWSDSAVLSFGLPTALDDGSGNFKTGALVVWLSVLDSGMDATDYHVTVGNSVGGPSGGIRFLDTGNLQTGSTTTAGAQLGSGTVASTGGRDAIMAFTVGGGTISMTTQVVQSDAIVSTPLDQSSTGHAIGGDELALVIGHWGATDGDVTLNARIRWAHFPVAEL